MSAIFIVDFTKRHSVNQFEWGNRYLIRANDLTEAITAVPLFEDLERGVHSEGIFIEQARVATLAANDGLYATIPLTWIGTLAATGIIFPGITTINVEVVVAGFGRPSRKFYHPWVSQALASSTAFQQWSSTFLSDTLTHVTDAIAALQGNATPLVDPDDQEWTNAVVVQKNFGFHQFHKRSPRTPS